MFTARKLATVAVIGAVALTLGACSSGGTGGGGGSNDPKAQNLKGRGTVKFAGQSYFHEDGSRAEGTGDGVQRLQEQDEDGIDAELLFVPVFASRFIERIPGTDEFTKTVVGHRYMVTEPGLGVGLRRELLRRRLGDGLGDAAENPVDEAAFVQLGLEFRLVVVAVAHPPEDLYDLAEHD